MTDLNPIEFSNDAWRVWAKNNDSMIKPNKVYLSALFYAELKSACATYKYKILHKDSYGKLLCFSAPCFIINDERHPSIVIA